MQKKSGQVFRVCGNEKKSAKQQSNLAACFEFRREKRRALITHGVFRKFQKFTEN
jgi:predicted phosphodiesterase